MKRIDDPDAAVERVMMDWRVIARASAEVSGEGPVSARMSLPVGV